MLASYDKTTGLVTLQFRLYGYVPGEEEGQQIPDPRRAPTSSGKQINVSPRIMNAEAGDGPLSDPVCDPVTGWPLKFNVSATVQNPDYDKSQDVKPGIAGLSQRELLKFRESISQAPAPTPAGMVQVPTTLTLADGTTIPAGTLLSGHMLAKLMTGMA